MNSSNPLARPNTGSLDDSSPATSDDESLGDMETWSCSVTAEMIQQLTDNEKKRQEIINGVFAHLTELYCKNITSNTISIHYRNFRDRKESREDIESSSHRFHGAFGAEQSNGARSTESRLSSFAAGSQRLA